MNEPQRPLRRLPEPDSTTKLITVEISMESATQAITQLRIKREEISNQLICINRLIEALEAGLQKITESSNEED